MMKHLTDDEIKAVYQKVDSRGDGDSRWWADCIQTCRRAIEAKSLDEAVDILRDADWGLPAESAQELRWLGRGLKRVPCSQCEGRGYLEVEDAE